MSRVSPTAEGFRAAFRYPSLTFGEIVWRWSIGATAVALFFFGLFEYLNTLPVTNGDLLFLRTRHPFFVAQAIAHIFRGSLTRAAMSAMIAALLLSLLWMVAASLGRIATVRVLLEYFRERLAIAAAELGSTDEREIPAFARRESFRPLMLLNFLRVVVALASVTGFIGAALLARMLTPSSSGDPVFLLLLLPVLALICFVWWALNWLLSLAAIFPVRHSVDAFSAISAGVTLCRERTGAVFAVSTWTGLAHLALFVTATTVVAMPLAFVGLLPWRLILLAVVVLTLVYLAIADWLYMARLAGFICVLEAPEALLAPPPPVPPSSVAPLQATIDRDELILSDVPGLVQGT